MRRRQNPRALFSVLDSVPAWRLGLGFVLEAVQRAGRKLFPGGFVSGKGAGGGQLSATRSTDGGRGFSVTCRDSRTVGQGVARGGGERHVKVILS